MPNSFDTYERDQKKSYDKETFEWITSWCDYANNHDLPRILLIGDSIVRGYYNHVKEALKDKVRVDYISTSYSITNPIYRKVVVEMAKNSKYQRIYFNFGLHAGGLSARSYKAGYKKVLKELLALAPVTVMASTTVYQNGKDKLDTAWKKRLAGRNDAVKALAEEYSLPYHDQKALCDPMPYSMRTQDGYHFTEDGYAVLAKALAERVLEEVR